MGRFGSQGLDWFSGFGSIDTMINQLLIQTYTVAAGCTRAKLPDFSNVISEVKPVDERNQYSYNYDSSNVNRES